MPCSTFPAARPGPCSRSAARTWSKPPEPGWPPSPGSRMPARRGSRRTGAGAGASSGAGPKTRHEFSAGGVVLQPEDGGYEVALASRRTRRGDLAWGLPKGLVESGEEPAAAAVREVLEETGLVAEIRG